MTDLPVPGRAGTGQSAASSIIGGPSPHGVIIISMVNGALPAIGLGAGRSGAGERGAGWAYDRPMEGADGSSPAISYGPAPQYPVESIDHALRVLLMLGEQSSVGVSEVGDRLGVATSTAHRLLAMLRYRGFVRHDPQTRRYFPGPTLDDLGFGVLRRFDGRALARPVLQRLSTELGETVHFGRLEGAHVRFVDSVESVRALRVASRSGRTMPAHCTSTGKVLLANLPDEEVCRLYPDEGLLRLTERSIGSRSELLGVLRRVRADGFATSREESEEGVSSVAMAVRSGQPTGLAVNVSVPVSRMNRALVDRAVEHLGLICEELGQMFGPVSAGGNAEPW